MVNFIYKLLKEKSQNLYIKNFGNIIIKIRVVEFFSKKISLILI